MIGKLPLFYLIVVVVPFDCQEPAGAHDSSSCRSVLVDPKTFLQSTQRGLQLMQKGAAVAKLEQQPPRDILDAWKYAIANASSSAADTTADVWYNSPTYFQQGNRKEDATFIRKHWSLFAAVLLVLCLMSCISIVDMKWESDQHAKEQQANLAASCQAFSHRLLQNLLPSGTIEKRRFRGLSRKLCSISLGFRKIGFEVAGHGKVLESVSGEFKAGRMTIILGPSGAGKTTFMNVLGGKATYGNMTGDIMVNGVKNDLANFKSVMGFVPQDDIVHAKLTVREQLYFSAQLRRAVGTDAITLTHIVDDVLDVLQLESIQHHIVGSISDRAISGGQRKRVNIGLELAAYPTLLFLDEPTSGLDATSSLAIVNSLKKMTQLGITIVAVAHQPRWSLFTLFDDVLLLAKGGRTVYLGPSDTVTAHFENLGFHKPQDENPADWLLDIVSGCCPNSELHSDMLADEWAKHNQFSTLHSGAETYSSRVWTAVEDRAALVRTLESEWARIDVQRAESISFTDLVKLLEACCGEKPIADVAGDLAAHMAGHGASRVTKSQFIDYLLGVDSAIKASSEPFASSVTHESGSDALQRVLPGFAEQFRVILLRGIVQISRNNKQRCIDVSLIVAVAVFLGWLHRGQMTMQNSHLASKILIFHLGLCLLICVSCLRVFGSDRLVWWRECGSGLNVLAFYCARTTIDTLDVFLQCVLYTAMFFLVASPHVAFRIFFIPCLLVSFAASGWGYFISVATPAENATLVAILFMMVTCGFLGLPSVGGYLCSTSITRWSTQMTYLGIADAEGSFVDPNGFPGWAQAEFQQLTSKNPPDPLDIFKACGFMSSSVVEGTYRDSYVNQRIGYWLAGFVILLAMAIVPRVLAYMSIIFTNRRKYA